MAYPSYTIRKHFSAFKCRMAFVRRLSISVWGRTASQDAVFEDEGTCEESKSETLNLPRDFIQLMSFQ